MKILWDEQPETRYCAKLGCLVGKVNFYKLLRKLEVFSLLQFYDIYLTFMCGTNDYYDDDGKL